MRIVFLCEQYPPHVWDGVGAYTAQVARALVAIGHEVHVLCAKGFRISDELDAGVHVHRRPPLRVPVTKLLGPLGRWLAGPNGERDSIGLRMSLTASYAFWLRAIGLKPDVIETQDGETRGLWFALRHEVPLVIHLHTPTMLDLRMRDGQLSLKGRIADKLDRMSARRADALTAPSELIVQTLRRYAWLSEQSEVSVIPLPFDAVPFERIAAPVHTTPTVLAVGRLEWRKGPDTLLDAVALLNQRGIEANLVLAGKSAGEIDGMPWDEWLRERADRLGVNCRFAGHVGSQKLQALYSEARVVAVPSRFDNFPMAALEGMAAGRPVVATTTNGLAGMIAQSRSGTLVPPDEPAALADALAPFLTNVGHAVSVGADGRLGMAAVEAKHIAAQREKVYFQAIAHHRARRGGALPVVPPPLVEAPPPPGAPSNGLQAEPPASA